MIRFAVLLFNMIGLLAYRMFFVGGVEVSQSVPSEMKPGTEYTIEVTVNKGTIGGFAKFQQDIPEGFTAVAVESKGASFSFSGTAVKFIWTSLPSEPEFKISYKITPSESIAAGEKTFGGKFYYVVDNAKQSVELEPAKVMIGGGATATNTNTQTPDNTNTQATNTNTQTPDNTNTQATNTNTNTQTPDNTNTQATNTNTNTNTQTPDNTNTQATNTNTQTPDNTNTQATNTNTQTTGNNTAQTTVGTQQGNVACTRKITPAGGNDYTVEMTIKKGNITGFAKLNENIPAGFTATAINSNKGSFTFTEQKIKLVWVALPQEPEFTISYKISGSAIMGEQIDGLLSYIENEETKKYIIPATAIGGGTSATATNTNTQTPDNTNTQATNTNTQTPDNTNTQATNTNTQTPDNNNTQATNTNTQTPDNTNTQATNTNTQTPDNNNTTVTPSNANVNYRVQICALKMSRMESSYFENKYSFSKVDMEQHEGWIKYLVGEFDEYKKARDYREQTRSKGVVGPFVTAYNSGRRITVQEALMITSQQWYR